MKEPILVVMAAGMGSRYGGLKQIDPVGENGEIIIDFSLFDARNAGFKKVVFLIKKAIEDDFKEIIGNRISKLMDVHYAYQEIDAMLPQGFNAPAERTKPWGTAHAVLCCKSCIDAPFAVINADDYYGKDAFKLIYNFLKDCDTTST
ncbi:MAG: nucleotidyltransferase, partial [Hydrogenoanaerobacterium sp.]